MKELLRNALCGRLVIFPPLFALYPVLFLYAHNIREISAGPILVPLSASILCTLLLWAALGLLLRSTSKAALATTIFVLLFFSYGRLYDLLKQGNVDVPGHRYLLPTALLAFGYIVYFINLTRRDFRTTSRILNIAATVLLSINVIGIALHQVRIAQADSAMPSGPEQPVATTIDPEKLKAMPDIYVIILDEYSPPDTMKTYYDYDNGWFTRSLEEKGFFVANESRTHKCETTSSIASLLNMEYVDSDTPPETIRHMNAENRVAAFLRSHGYRILYFNSPYFFHLFGQYSIGPDAFYDPRKRDGNINTPIDFPRLLLGTTMLKPIYDHFTQSQYKTRLRHQVLDPLEALKRAPGLSGPKFIFVHIPCPHSPFIFGPHGEPVGAEHFLNFRDKRFYRDQLIYISHAIDATIDVLVANSSIDPIIILQSDHGIRSHHDGIELPVDSCDRILNAYLLPDGGREDLRNSLSPANSFRVIFNRYFDAHYNLLDDTPALRKD